MEKTNSRGMIENKMKSVEWYINTARVNNDTKVNYNLIIIIFSKFNNISTFVELPVPSRPVRSLTRPFPNPYLSLSRLASLGLSRSHKGTGTDTIFDLATHHH